TSQDPQENERAISQKKMDTNMYTHPSLASQLPTQAPAADKIRQAILATAMVDALGGPTEFQERFTFPKVTDMIPNDNFSLPPGYWTDDTSMTLCLARSLATFRSTTSSSSSSDRTERGGFDEGDQLRWYNQWYKHGTLSPNGRCFDIGSSVREALSIYARHRDVENALQQIQVRLDREECSGNGSLMRVLPIGLTYWRDEKAAREYARRSSRTTHPNLMCQEACEVWTKAIVEIMKASTAETPTMEPAYTKLDLVQTFAEFPFTNAQLREALQFPAGTPVPPTHNEERERHFFKYHPVLRLLARTQNQTIPSEEDLPSSGYNNTDSSTFLTELTHRLRLETIMAGVW
ncbi:hypothetical protein H0H93_007377, partial [Arthromyces matolae]